MLRYLLLFLLLGCTKEIKWQPGYTTEELDSAIQSFETNFEVDVNFDVLLVKEFSIPQAPGTDGICYNSGWPRRVEILENQPGLELVVYHELGHCALNIGHYEGPMDIMNSKPSLAITWDFEHYVQQMLSNYKNNLYPFN